jgi:hypothetical protein
MSHKQHSKPLTLEEAQKQFQLWRANKAPGATVPESLWGLVTQLLENTSYKRTMIGRVLGISTHQFRTKFPNQFKPKSTAVIQAASKNPRPFVQAPLDALIMPQSSSAQLMIERPNGTKFIFTGLTQEHFLMSIKAVME